MSDCLFLFLLQDRYDKGEDLSERAIVKLIFYSAPELSLRPKTTEVYELPNVSFTCVVIQTICFKISLSCCTVEPLLRGHPDQRPPPLERPLDNVNLNINVLISTPDERPPLLKGHFSDAKGVASQQGFHCFIMLCTSQFQSFQDLSVFFRSLYINLFIKFDIFSFKLLCQVGLVVSVSTFHTVSRGFTSQSGHTKDHHNKKMY